MANNNSFLKNLSKSSKSLLKDSFFEEMSGFSDAKDLFSENYNKVKEAKLIPTNKSDLKNLFRKNKLKNDKNIKDLDDAFDDNFSASIDTGKEFLGELDDDIKASLKNLNEKKASNPDGMNDEYLFNDDGIDDQTTKNTSSGGTSTTTSTHSTTYRSKKVDPFKALEAQVTKIYEMISSTHTDGFDMINQTIADQAEKQTDFYNQVSERLANFEKLTGDIYKNTFVDKRPGDEFNEARNLAAFLNGDSDFAEFKGQINQTYNILQKKSLKNRQKREYTIGNFISDFQDNPLQAILTGGVFNPLGNVARNKFSKLAELDHIFGQLGPRGAAKFNSIINGYGGTSKFGEYLADKTGELANEKGIKGALGNKLHNIIEKSQKKNKNGMSGLDTVLSMLGIDTDPGLGNKNSFLRNRVKPETPVKFDAETHTTINKVIPGYLAEMLSGLTHQSRIHYDYESGQWKSEKNVKKSIEKGMFDAVNFDLDNNKALTQFIQKNNLKYNEEDISKVFAKRALGRKMSTKQEQEINDRIDKIKNSGKFWDRSDVLNLDTTAYGIVSDYQNNLNTQTRNDGSALNNSLLNALSNLDLLDEEGDFYNDGKVLPKRIVSNNNNNLKQDEVSNIVKQTAEVVSEKTKPLNEAHRETLQESADEINKQTDDKKGKLNKISKMVGRILGTAGLATLINEDDALANDDKNIKDPNDDIFDTGEDNENSATDNGTDSSTGGDDEESSFVDDAKDILDKDNPPEKGTLKRKLFDKWHNSKLGKKIDGIRDKFKVADDAEDLAKNATKTGKLGKLLEKFKASKVGKLTGKLSGLFKKGVGAVDNTADKFFELIEKGLGKTISLGGKGISKAFKLAGKGVSKTLGGILNLVGKGLGLGTKLMGKTLSFTSKMAGKALGFGTKVAGKALGLGAKVAGKTLKFSGKVAGKALKFGGKALGTAAKYGGKAVGAAAKYGGKLGKWFFKDGAKGFLKKAGPLDALFLITDTISAWHGDSSTRGKRVGKAIGSNLGGMAGMALGSIFGPVGTIVGGFLGDLVGGGLGTLAGKGVDWFRNRRARKQAQKLLEYNDQDPYAGHLVADASQPKRRKGDKPRNETEALQDVTSEFSDKLRRAGVSKEVIKNSKKRDQLSYALSPFSSAQYFNDTNPRINEAKKWMKDVANFTSSAGANGTSSDNSSASGATGTASGNSNEEKVYNFFKSSGYSDKAAAGITGNVMQESSANPTASNGSHNGIFQWDNGRYAKLTEYAKSKGKSPTDLQTQLEFALTEIRSTNGLDDALKSASSTKEATDVFENKFERSGGSALAKREQYAEQAYNKYQQNVDSDLDKEQKKSIADQTSSTINEQGDSSSTTSSDGQTMDSDGQTQDDGTDSLSKSFATMSDEEYEKLAQRIGDRYDKTYKAEREKIDEMAKQAAEEAAKQQQAQDQQTAYATSETEDNSNAYDPIQAYMEKLKNDGSSQYSYGNSSPNSSNSSTNNNGIPNDSSDATPIDPTNINKINDLHDILSKTSDIYDVLVKINKVVIDLHNNRNDSTKMSILKNILTQINSTNNLNSEEYSLMMEIYQTMPTESLSY